MTKKKTNPNRIPIPQDSFDINDITMEASTNTVLKAWAIFLGAFIDFSQATSESIVQLWEDVNSLSNSIHKFEDIADDLKIVEKVAGLSSPFVLPSPDSIKTQGDLERFKRRAHQHALYAAFAIIAAPIIKGQLLSDEDTNRVFRKAYSISEEIALGKKGRLSLEDILEALEDEFHLRLYDDNGRITLCRITP